MRMILVRDRGTEQGEDSVPGRLNYVASIVIHRVDHQVQCRIYNGARLLRIDLLHQIHRALDIGEQSGDRLPLPVRRVCHGSLGRDANRVLRRR
jgi:hypothetical protein